MNRTFTALLFAIAAAVPVSAQNDEPEERPVRSEVELQFFSFGNFFQARAGAPERTVNALGAAYQAFWKPRASFPDLYGRASVLRYSGDASDTQYTGRLGVASYGSVHWYDVALEHTENGYAFDIEETRATASITSLRGHYSYRIARDWRVGADTYFERQRFDVDTDVENDYQSIGAQVRYRGFGDLIEPRIGYTVGHRDVKNDVDSYDDRYWYIQLSSEPLPNVDVSLRYRDRTRDYDSVDRREDRGQWTARATIRQNERLRWALSYSDEDVGSSLPGRSFGRSTAYVGVLYGF